MIQPKLSFFHFVRHAAYSFDDPASIEWTDSFLKRILERDLVHGGDCTKQSHACDLCVIETLLNDYHHYYFQYEQWKKDNFGTDEN
jgi:hypothetical protein